MTYDEIKYYPDSRNEESNIGQPVTQWPFPFFILFSPLTQTFLKCWFLFSGFSISFGAFCSSFGGVSFSFCGLSISFGGFFLSFVGSVFCLRFFPKYL